MPEQWPPIALPELAQGSMEPNTVLELMSYSPRSHMHQLCDIIWGVDAWLGSCRRMTPRTIMIVLVFCVPVRGWGLTCVSLPLGPVAIVRMHCITSTFVS